MLYIQYVPNNCSRKIKVMDNIDYYNFTSNNG